MKLCLICTVLKVKTYKVDTGSKMLKKRNSSLLKRTCDMYSALKSAF